MTQFILHESGSPEYEASIRIFNGAASSGAKAVIWPGDVRELSAVVEAAPLAVNSLSFRSGGHGVAGRAVSGDWVVDFRRLQKIEFSKQFVDVGAGVTWGQLDAALFEHGLAVPGGTVSSTGVTGLTLGGGVGWLLPLHGLSCDHLVSVRGIDGHGREVLLDDSSDLMAVIRGNGHGLLAITSLRFEPVRLSAFVSAGSVVFPIESAELALTDLMAVVEVEEDGVGWSPALLWVDGRPVLSVDGVSFMGTSFDQWVCKNVQVPVIANSVSARPYPAAQSMLDNTERWGKRTGWRSVFCTTLNSEAISYILEAFLTSPSRGCQIFIELIRGAGREARRPSTFPLRGMRVDVLFTATWSEKERDAVHLSWLNRVKEGLSKILNLGSEAATYINYADDTEQVLFADEDFATAIDQARRSLDPLGLFAVNYRI